jgi:transcriptional/translational regulatory protein YebC/TACO1
VITVDAKEQDAEALALEAIDAGAEDVKIENNYIELYTRPEELEKVREALKQKNIPVASAEVSRVPKTVIQLEEKAALQTLRLLDKLEELDEVQYVSSNADFPDSILEKYQSLSPTR